jgi:hypothetical protein
MRYVTFFLTILLLLCCANASYCQCTTPPPSYTGLNKFTYGDGTNFLDTTNGLYWLPLKGHEGPLFKIWLVLLTNSDFTSPNATTASGESWCDARDKIYNTLGVSYKTIDALHDLLSIDSSNSAVQKHMTTLTTRTIIYGTQQCPDKITTIIGTAAVNQRLIIQARKEGRVPLAAHLGDPLDASTWHPQPK